MRISFEKMAANIAEEASKRSEDIYQKVGCVVLDEKYKILSIGYNGLKSKQKVKNNFWKNRDLRRKYIIHAEINALSCVTRNDNPYMLVSTLLPCSSCARTIACYGIKKVLYNKNYKLDQEAKNIFKFYNIKLQKY
jgi:dCMP deaminase